MEHSTESPTTVPELLNQISTTGETVTTSVAMPLVEDIRSIHEIQPNDIFNVEHVGLDTIETSALSNDSNTQTNLICLCNQFFGDKFINETTGLVAQYKRMREHVQTKNLIGVVLAGLNMNDILINNYTTNNISRITNRYIVIKLTVASITRTLLREYFTKDEINALCLALQSS